MSPGVTEPSGGGASARMAPARRRIERLLDPGSFRELPAAPTPSPHLAALGLESSADDGIWGDPLHARLAEALRATAGPDRRQERAAARGERAAARAAAAALGAD